MADFDVEGHISTIEQLEGLYRAASKVAAQKSIAFIDEASARFIDTCPFVVLSTSGADGTVDASPRGGPPGFLQRLDDKHVALPDLNGNNRLDSHRNIVVNGHVGLLLLIPTQDETLRINGPAVLSTDSAILEGFTAELRPPKLAIIIRTDELYLHCAKALRRSQLWDPASWDRFDRAPDGAEIYATQFDEDASTMRDYLDQSYEHDLALD